MASEALSLQLAQLMEKTHTLDGKHFRWMSKDLKRVHDLVRNIRDMLPAERYCSPWLESVKDAFYEAEDILDKFHSEASRYHIHMALLDADGRINEMVSSLFSFSRQPPILSRLMMQRKMQKKMENLKNILIKIESSRRETAPFVVEGEVINRDLEKVEIVKQLIAYAEEACVGGLPVVGIRGINKTALARLVYDDVWVVKNFQLRLWIDVSYEFDLERITRDIIETATREVSSGRTLEEVSSGRTLEEVIHGKRYLLVLNDVFCRDPSKWDELRLQLRYGEVGSTVIVTASIPTVEDERMWISTMDDGF